VSRWHNAFYAFAGDFDSRENGSILSPIVPIRNVNCSRSGTLRAMAIATLRKAAVFLASLPNQQAAELLATLSPEQAAAVSAEMGAIEAIDRDEQEAVVREVAAFDAPEVNVVEPPKPDPFEFLHNISADDLLALIGDEHPQTIALILSQLPTEQAAGVIAALSAERQTSVVARIAKLDQPSQEVIAEVADSIHRRVVGPVSVPISRGMARVVKMFGAMRPATERKLLGGIAEADPELLHAIRCAMFGPDVAAFAESNITGAAC
jgi:flagellar motor switch protein FliG